jgi:hypothetical protein
MANARPACWNRARLAPCPSSGAEMHLFRRSPEPRHHAYEVQILSCMKCDAEITRSETARRHSVTRSPRGGVGASSIGVSDIEQINSSEGALLYGLN